MTNQNKTRDSFIFYRSFFSATKHLNQVEKAQLFEAICSYALDGNLSLLEGTPQGMFELIKPQLDANRKRFENGCKKKQKISKTEAKNKQTISKDEANVNVNVNVNHNEECKSELINDNLNNNSKGVEIDTVKLMEIDKIKTKRFIKPNIQEIKDYCLERKNNVDVNKFFNYYEANGWKVGKNAMKDWKACIRTWEGNDYNKPQISQPKQSFMTKQQIQEQRDKDIYARLIQQHEEEELNNA
jgi:hypothetical protein